MENNLLKTGYEGLVRRPRLDKQSVVSPM